MKRFMPFVILLALVSFVAMASSLELPPSESEWSDFFNLLRGLKGASWFAVAVVVVQGVFYLLRSSVGELLGIYRLLVLAVLSVLVTIGTNIMAGKTVIHSILLDSSTLLAYQVLFYQIKKQWEKRDQDSKASEAKV